MSGSKSLKRQFSELLGGKTIYRVCDQWGEMLVIDRRRRRILTFGSVFEQSCMDRSDPALLVHDYARAMMLVMAFADAPQAVTVLGVGGGAIIRAIMALYPDAHIDAVELRPEVVTIAHDWFQLPRRDSLRIHIGDAGQYLAGRKAASTNIVFSDIYHAHGMSPLQSQEEFVRGCRRILTEPGWLVMNVYGSGGQRGPCFKLLSSLFAQVWLCTVDDGNQVLLAGGGPGAEHGTSAPDLPDRFQRLQDLERHMNARLDLLFRRLSRIH